MKPHLEKYETSPPLLTLDSYNSAIIEIIYLSLTKRQGKEKFGRVIGPNKNEWNEMAQDVLTTKGTVVPRRTLRSLTPTEMNNEGERRKRDIFVTSIREKLGDPSRSAP